MAVLRVDDRGTGKSTGDWIKASYEGYGDDVRCGLACLKSRPEIDGGRIGLLGHSEGGIIAAMVASKSPDVAFVILLASPCIPGEEQVVKTNELMLATGQCAGGEDRQGFGGRQNAVPDSPNHVRPERAA